MSAIGAGASSEVDLSLPENGGLPRSAPIPFTGLEDVEGGRAVLDDFNRANGPLGPSWTVQTGTFAIVSQTARGSSNGLATHNSGAGNVVEMDIAVDGSGVLQFAGAVLDYGGGATNVFIKVQAQSSTDFSHAACYTGNPGSTGSFGLGFFALSQTFASAHLKVLVDVGRTVTVDLTNINGGALPDQQYICTGAPPPEGPAIGMAGYTGRASIDNFASSSVPYPMVRSFAYPVPPVVTPVGLVHNGGGYLIGTDLGTDSVFSMDTASPTASIVFGPVDISATNAYPIGITHDTVTLYITDNSSLEVDSYDGAANYLSSFSVAAHTTFPEGIAWNPLNGRLYLVNGTTGANLVHELTTAGAHITDYPIPGSSPDGLAWDPLRECFWLYDSGTDRIRQYTPTFTQMSWSPGTAAAGFGNGEGLAVIGDLLYVVARDSLAVVEFSILGAPSAVGFLFSDGFESNGLSAWDSSSP